MSKQLKANSETGARKRFPQQVPSNAKLQNELADEMVQWVHNDSSWNLEDFPISKDMAPCRFYKLAESNDYFDIALNLSRWVIASKLLTGWRNKDLDKDYCLRLLPLYNKQYHDYMMAKIQSDAKGKAMGNFIIQQDAIPHTVEVDEQLKKKSKKQ